MYLIEARNSYDGIFYDKKFIKENGEIAFKETIHFRNAKSIFKDKEYIFLYDVDMNPIPEVFDYLNFELQDASPNHRYTALNALKLLYSFLKIYDLKIDSLSKNDVFKFFSFLEGNSREGTLYQFNSDTVRSPSTINTYLTLIRGFVSNLGHDKSPLLKKVIIINLFIMMNPKHI